MQSNKRNGAVLAVTLFFLLLLMLLSLRFGSTYLATRDFFGGLLRKAGYERSTVILYAVRLPRMLAGVFAGAGLALSGSLLQRVTDNPLAAPNVLGINAGAGFFVILCLSLFPAHPHLIPLAAFFGAATVALCILALSRKLGADRLTITL